MENPARFGEAVYARCLSAMKDERVAASKTLKGPKTKFRGDRKAFVEDIRRALLASKIKKVGTAQVLIKAGKGHRFVVVFRGKGMEGPLTDADPHREGLRIPEAKPRWEAPCPDSSALAVGDNACVVARPTEIAAYDLTTGTRLWTHPLTAAPVPWGLCLDRDGHVIVSLTNGHVLCLAAAEMAAE